jgi:hypothetical protein
MKILHKDTKKVLMMKKLLCVAILTLLAGCTNDKTDELCTLMKHSGVNASLDNTACVIYDDNASIGFALRCSTMTQYFTLIVYTNRSISDEISILENRLGVQCSMVELTS